MLDNEAEESGDEMALDHEGEDLEDGTGKMIIPEGIDIVERTMTEKERMDVVDYHRRLKERADEEQIEFVKRGVKEGASYMRRMETIMIIIGRPNA